ncbi:DNA mismatch repair endonuclease MutL [Legionella brunensis]|uniref:DNA mismatch repair protein MutL n=1 Tax=Legionella brunensis TaxID=29422 RepID=A0A0W0SPD2_9GAMM|nr:DNA mismatch repair endonuclease MutL [Legionella brunensis]KTC85156.1 DNA mismatch repair protein MutL [Legionella brunensis]
MRIQQLPLALANQIAAGEVIERPASIVKELLENSLDAKASLINIEIGYGGLNQVKISDNGIGILAEDLPLAIAPHATSKISQLSDLYSIASMGFRGEALASIASISRLTISSKPAEQTHAMKLLSYGESIQLEPCARNEGTTVDVRDIFFNAPIRKKFLKTERIEFQAIEMVVKRFALSAPQIAITLSHNEKKILDLPAANCDKTKLARIRKILGKAFIEQAYFIDIEQSGMRLVGWVGKENYQRSQNDKQWIYINMRMVRDKLLNHAIKQAYENFLHPGRYPSCLLYLTIPPQEVDVNVHPTKHEVRFQQPRLVHDFISTQIHHALQLSKESGQYKLLEEKEFHAFQVSEPYISPASLPTAKEQFPFDPKNWITLNEHFILIFLQEQPYLVDIIALYRHWLRALLLKQERPFISRPLLVPVSHNLDNLNLQQVNRCKSYLAEVGIDISLMGENVIFIRTLPISLPYLNLKQFLNAIFKEVELTNLGLVELLLKHQLFDPRNATQEEKEALIAHMEVLGNDNERHTWRRQLSAQICWDLLNA